MPHIVIHAGGIGPIRLDGDKPESLFDDQVTGDPLTHPVEFAGSVGRFAEQHDASRSDSMHQRIEIGSLNRRKRFRGVCKIADQRFLAQGNGRQRPAPSRGLRSMRSPPLFPDQRNEAHVGDIFAAKSVFRDAGDPHQLLGTLIRADRNHQPSADLQLLLERFRNLRAAGRDDDCIIWRMFAANLCVPSPCRT